MKAPPPASVASIHTATSRDSDAEAAFWARYGERYRQWLIDRGLLVPVQVVNARKSRS